MSRLLPALALAGLLGACGGKRPPAVVSETSPALPSGEAAAGTPPAYQVVEAGPDVRPQTEGALSESELEALAREGGPLGDVTFAFDQASLGDEARATLGKSAAWLTANPGVSVTIEGHCDERGTAEYNLALGNQRALAAKDYLVSLGVAEARLRVVSYGKERPLDAEHGEAAWARNRRAHFVVRR